MITTINILKELPRYTHRRVVLLALNCLLLPAVAISSDIRLTLSIEKTTYVNGEMIFLACSVENQTPKEVVIAEPSTSGALRVHLFDESAQELPNRWGMLRFSDKKIDNRIKLMPHTRTIRAVNLMSYGQSMEVTGGSHHFLPGTYRIFVALDDTKSNIVEFKIVEPNHDEQMVANDLSRIASFKNENIAIAQCKEIIRSNPRSAYLLNAYWELISLLMVFDSGGSDLQQQTLELIRRYPNSSVVATAINYYRVGLERQAGISRSRMPTFQQTLRIEGKLNEVRRDCVGTQAVEYIGEEISRAKRDWASKK